MKKYYITTPIYYANWAAHIWHAYTSLMTDIIARSKRLLWYKVKFTSWIDENWQKMMQKASEENMEIMEFLDWIAAKHLLAWEKLKISYTDYIRTSEKRHHEFVKKVILKCYENWDIYKWKYEWLYCVWCEAYKKSDELTPDWLCPDHLKKPEKIVEENYFFKLKKYKDKIVELYKNNPNFVSPDFRFNEIKAFVARWLEDFSVSRKWNENDFRIKFPLDETHVVYIWFDALFSYITALDWETDTFWPADLHIMAKDIIKFHAIFWPAMLMSAWYQIPQNLLSHGYFTVDGQKMSKTIWNVIDPIEIVEKYWRDGLVFYLFYDIIVWNDGDFNQDRFKGVYDSMLLGGWWNLVSRVSNLAAKNGISKGKLYQEKLNKFLYLNTNFEWDLTKTKHVWNELEKKWLWPYSWSTTNEFIINLDKWTLNINEILEDITTRYNIQKYLQSWYELVQLCNKYMQDEQPWTKIKSEDTKQDWIEDLEFLLYMIKQLWLLSSTFLIEWFEKLQNILWNSEILSINTEKDWWLNEWKLKEIFDMKEFNVNLVPGLLYSKIE